MPETNPSAGATPAEPGATPGQSAPPAAPAAGTPPTPPPAATDGTDALGDAGKRALDRMKDERDAAKTEAKAQKERADALELGTKTETEQAIAKARTEGGAEAASKLKNGIRRSEVKAALMAAGLSTMLDLAVRADEFASLEVDDDGEVAGLSAAVTAFKGTHADLFKAAVAPGTADGGARGGSTITVEQARAWARDPAMYELHRDEILKAMAAKP